MSNSPFDHHEHQDPYATVPLAIDEGGLRAPPHLTGWRKAWWWFDFIILVKLSRLRFIAVLAAIGIVITQWDTLNAYYDRWTRPAGDALHVSGDLEWFCPMHPAIIRDNPKDKCPICFMPLSKRKKGDNKEQPLPAGIVNRVQLSPYRVVLAGVQTFTVEYMLVSKQITAVGYVEFNERGQKDVTARSKGRIDKLFVNETGQLVAAGQELASLYSPDLNVTVQSLVDAQRSGNAELLRSTRVRLQLLGISDDQIDEIVATGKSNTHLKIRSPISGHIIKKYIREGQYVDEGTPLYDVADLSSVWIQAQIYEDDMGFLPVEHTQLASAAVQAGFTVTATTRAFPNETFRGSLAFIYPHVDQNTRTVSVRFEVENRNHRLRPGSTATVALNIPPQMIEMLIDAVAADPKGRTALENGQVLAVPETAVIDTGSQTIVYREASPGVYEGVLVKLGPRMLGPHESTVYPVLSGLQAGERIVTIGSFLVDAETRLNPAAGSIYFGGSGGSKSGGGSVTTARPSTPEDPDATIQAGLASLSTADRPLAEAQKYCPVLSDSRLGSMGAPVKLTVAGETVFICCEGCKSKALADPEATLRKIKQRKDAPPAPSSPAAVVPEPKPESREAEIRASLAMLSDADRKLAVRQQYCPVATDSRLGWMGPPVRLSVAGETIFLCCEGCKEQALADPEATLRKVKQRQQTPEAVSPPAAMPDPKAGNDPEAAIREAFVQLSEADRRMAAEQRFCVVSKTSRLGSMGAPVKVMVQGQPVFLCCEHCRTKALANPQATLTTVEQLKKATGAGQPR